MMDGLSKPQTEAHAPRARTKIVATVGPAADSRQALQHMVDAGADVFRLNTAHGTQDEFDRILDDIIAIRQRRRPVAVLVDLAGPKIRLTELPGDTVHCQVDQTIRFVRGDTSSATELASNYERLVDDLNPGDTLLLADGAVSMTVTGKGDDYAECRVVSGGEIRSRQGINLPGVKISLPALTDKDRQFAEWAARRDADFVSLSFVRSPAELNQLRELLRSLGSQAWVMAKIEKPEALDQLDEIVAASDAIMVARGDLGVEIDVADIPVAQKRIIATCNRLQRPVIVATQMLDSMQHEPRPTRAESTDVANAVLDGADACMLSGETAVGKFPVATIQTMNRILLATEPLLRERPVNQWDEDDGSSVPLVTRAVVYGAARIADCVQAKMVVIATRSGATAVAKSSQRDFIPCVAASPDETTLRHMCLLWGITPLAGAPCDDTEALRDYVIRWGQRDGSLADGDRIVVIAGTGLQRAIHNQVFVHTVGESMSEVT